MNRNTLVSVILPAYNAEKFIAKTIHSLLSQTYKNIEIIIINDGSSDQTENIILSFNDDRIKYIKQENQGLSKTLNKAISIANSDYLCRIDSDDICEQNRIEIQMSHFLKNDNLVLVGSNVTFIDEKDNITGYSYSAISDKAIRHKLLKGNSIFHPTVILKKTAVLNVGGYDEIINIFFEDYILWLKLKNEGAFYICPQHLVKYREHNQSISSKTPTEIYDIIKLYISNGKLTPFQHNKLNEIKTKFNDLNSQEKKTSVLFKLLSRNKNIAFIISVLRGFFHV